jgi:hypothetical protein
MSENLDVVRSILACWERGELLPEQWSQWADPEMEIEQLRASLFHLRGGKVTRRVNYWDRDRALADLGLEE